MNIKNTYKPQNYGPTKSVVLFTNARDEKNIKEWASHHLLIGFDKIIIFDHKSITPLKDVFLNFDNITFSKAEFLSYSETLLIYFDIFPTDERLFKNFSSGNFFENILYII